VKSTHEIGNAQLASHLHPPFLTDQETWHDCVLSPFSFPNEPRDGVCISRHDAEAR
jgi:hypothetical protein